MIVKGKPYDAEGDDAKERNILKRRCVYSVEGTATDEQRNIIDKIERGLATGYWSEDPAHLYFVAEDECIGIWEEELYQNGEWHRHEIGG